MAAALHLRCVHADDPTAADHAIRNAIGERIVGRESDLNAVGSGPEDGRPLRPLVLVVRDDQRSAPSRCDDWPRCCRRGAVSCSRGEEDER